MTEQINQKRTGHPVFDNILINLRISLRSRIKFYSVNIVCYESPEELVSLCDYYLRHEEERKQIAENGKKRIESDFTPEKQLQKLLEQAQIWDIRP